MSTSAITPPAGFELEKPQSQGVKPPPGFELESPHQAKPAGPQPSVWGVISQPMDKTDREYTTYRGPAGVAGATIKGLDDVGHSTVNAIRGIGNLLNPQAQPGEEGYTLPGIPDVAARPIIRAGKGLHDTAAQATQIPAAIHDINHSPDPTGDYLNAAQGTASDAAGQAILGLGTEGIARSIPEAATPIARRMYQSAIKPSTTLGADRVGQIVDTGLGEKIPVSEGGQAKLGERLGEVNDQIKSTIDSAPLRTVNKYKVASRLSDTAKKFGTQVNPEADLNAIGESGNEFLRNQPGEIPGPDAQALKQGTYRTLNKKYGEIGSASTESQKTLARGLKEELANTYPELNELNATDSRLINLHDALEKAVLRSANREPFGIGGPMAGLGVKLAGGGTPMALAATALKTALRNPMVRSRLAIALNGTSRSLGRPGLGASIGGGAGSSALATGRIPETEK